MKNCCTLWFKGWWNEACCKHDEDYKRWRRGAGSRLEADNDLFYNVLTSLDHKSKLLRIVSLPVASIMWIGVRIGGKLRRSP